MKPFSPTQNHRTTDTDFLSACMSSLRPQSQFVSCLLSLAAALDSTFSVLRGSPPSGQCVFSLSSPSRPPFQFLLHLHAPTLRRYPQRAFFESTPSSILITALPQSSTRTRESASHLNLCPVFESGSLPFTSTRLPSLVEEPSSLDRNPSTTCDDTLHSRFDF